jgi:choice-of-anchor C domain-containing protein
MGGKRSRRVGAPRRVESLERRTLLAATVSVGDARQVEGDDGLVDAVFDVTLSEPAAQAVTVRYRTHDGSATASAAGTNLVANGSFEEPPVTFFDWNFYPAGSALGAWTVGGHSVDLVAGWQDAAGNQSVDLNGADVGSVFQDVATVPGQAYLLRFALSGNPETIPAVKQIEVSFGGESVAVESFDTTGRSISDMGWAYRTHAVTAFSDVTRLTFASVTPFTNGGPMVDDVSLVAVRDYVPEPAGLVTIPAGQTRAAIRVPVVGDLLDEPDETFTVALLEATGGATVGTPSVGTGTIVNDDHAPVITVRDATVVEGNVGTAPLGFEVRVRQPSDVPVTVEYTLSDGTARAGSDFDGAGGTVTIPAFTGSATIPVPVLADTMFEEDERFTLTLRNPSRGTLTDAEAVGVVVNDDPMPLVSVDDVFVAEGDSGTRAATFTVTVSSVIDRPMTVSYFTANGSAGSGSDYVATNGTLTIPANASRATVAVTVLGDTLPEVNETFLLTISDASHAMLGDAQGVATIVNDDVPPGGPEISVGDVAVREGDEGTVPALFVVTLSEPAFVPVSVNYSLAGGTALVGYDVQLANGTLTFEPGEVSKVIGVDVIGDRLDEPAETFFLNLTAPLNGVIADGQGRGTILPDDDRPPTVDVADVAPDPRYTPVGSIVIVFNERVVGLTLSDLNLSRDRGPNLLGTQQTLRTDDGGVTWTVGNLAGVTATPGNYTLNLPAGSASGVTDLEGNPAPGAIESWTVQPAPAPAPAVAGVFVAGAHWTQPFKDYLQATGAGDAAYGYALPAGTAQLDTLPWSGLNRVAVRFSRDVIVAEDDLKLVGVNVRNYPFTAFEYDEVGHTATWTLALAPAGDRLMLALNGGADGIADAQTGLALDGEWFAPAAVDAFPSGDGTAGGDFRFRVDVLAGDAVRTARVDVIDSLIIRRRRTFSAANPGAGGYTPFLDVTGDGLLNDADALVVRRNLGRTLPSGVPQAPPFPVEAAASPARRSRLLARRGLLTDDGGGA